MAHINVLDISVANLIAAGEVVERPSSALKELCENSIDAGAKNITVEIKNGGISLLRITDDGCGMTGEDAVLSVKRHATSKIKTAEDLASVYTLGFRGEALAAITAVTETRIMTKRREDKEGTLLTVSYGTLSGVSESGCPDGTTVICERLFATTPARLKFLKSDSAEAAVCRSTTEKLALSHPDIAFRFIADGTMRFSTPGDGKLKNVIYSVFGREFVSKLCEIDSKSGGISVSGYTGTPDNVRGNRGLEIFFINGRCVRNAQLTAALESAFRSYIPIGKYPVCVLYISLNSSLVDVNIHPSKLDVKFSDEKGIFDAVYYSVRGALERNLKNPSLTPKDAHLTEEKLKIIQAIAPVTDVPIHKQTDIYGGTAGKPYKPKPFTPSFECETGILYTEKTAKVASPAGFIMEEKPEKKPDISIEYEESDNNEIIDGKEKKEAGEATFKARESTDAMLSDIKKSPIPEYKITGELFNCYVIVETGDRILFIDKHAAHERINFERLSEASKKASPAVQKLLITESVPLSGTEREAAERSAKRLVSLGYIYTVDENGAIISGIPAGFEIAEAKDLFFSIVSSVAENESASEMETEDYFEKLLYQSACKASVKGGRKYDGEHIKWICDNLFRYDCIKRCPHGRPVACEMTKRELDVMFERIK